MSVHVPAQGRRPRTRVALWLSSVVFVLALLAPAAANAATAGALFQDPTRDGCFRDLGGGGCNVGRGLREAMSVAASPDGRSLYVAAAGDNDNEGSVAIFSRDPNTGRLTQPEGGAGCFSETATFGSADCTRGIGLIGAKSVAVSPDGKWVYVGGSDYAGNVDGQVAAIAVFSRDTSTGALSQAPGLAGCMTGTTGWVDPRCTPVPGEFGELKSIVISQDGKFAYTASPDINDTGDYGEIGAFARDDATGLFTRIPGTDIDGYDNGCVRQQQGSSNCRPGRAIGEPMGLVLSPDGNQLYVAASEGQMIFDSDGAVSTFNRDPATGVLTQPAGPAGCINTSADDGSGAGTCGQGRALHDTNHIAIAPDGRSVYTAAQGDYYCCDNFQKVGAMSIFSRDTTNGTITQVPGTEGCVSGTGGNGYQPVAEGDPPVCKVGRAQIEPTGVAVSPDGGSVYLASSDQPAALSVFERDASTSVVTQLDGAAGCISAGGLDSDAKSTCTVGNGLDGVSYPLALAAANRAGCVHVYAASSDENALTIMSRQVECAPPAAIKPTVVTQKASNLKPNSVTLNGTLDPGNADTTYSFEYGTTTAYGLYTAARPVSAGGGPRAVAGNVDGLQASRTYHYRLVATNSGGTSVGQDLTFKTPLNIPRRKPRGLSVKIAKSYPGGEPRLTTTGTVLLPKGLAKRACKGGRVAVQVKANGNTTISNRRTAVSGKTCRFKSSVTFHVAQRLGKTRRLKVTVRFLGSPALLPVAKKPRFVQV